MNETLRNYSLKVEGMSCEGCENKIERKLEQAKGVLEVKADHKAQKVDIRYDLAETDLEKIMEEIKRLNQTPVLGFLEKMKLRRLERKEVREKSQKDEL